MIIACSVPLLAGVMQAASGMKLSMEGGHKMTRSDHPMDGSRLMTGPSPDGEAPPPRLTRRAAAAALTHSAASRAPQRASRHRAAAADAASMPPPPPVMGRARTTPASAPSRAGGRPSSSLEPILERNGESQNGGRTTSVPVEVERMRAKAAEAAATAKRENEELERKEQEESAAEEAKLRELGPSQQEYLMRLTVRSATDGARRGENTLTFAKLNDNSEVEGGAAEWKRLLATGVMEGLKQIDPQLTEERVDVPSVQARTVLASVEFPLYTVFQNNGQIRGEGAAQVLRAPVYYDKLFPVRDLDGGVAGEGGVDVTDAGDEDAVDGGEEKVEGMDVADEDAGPSATSGEMRSSGKSAWVSHDLLRIMKSDVLENADFLTYFKNFVNDGLSLVANAPTAQPTDSAQRVKGSLPRASFHVPRDYFKDGLFKVEYDGLYGGSYGGNMSDEEDQVAMGMPPMLSPAMSMSMPPMPSRAMSCAVPQLSVGRQPSVAISPAMPPPPKPSRARASGPPAFASAASAVMAGAPPVLRQERSSARKAGHGQPPRNTGVSRGLSAIASAPAALVAGPSVVAPSRAQSSAFSEAWDDAASVASSFAMVSRPEGDVVSVASRADSIASSASLVTGFRAANFGASSASAAEAEEYDVEGEGEEEEGPVEVPHTPAQSKLLGQRAVLEGLTRAITQNESVEYSYPGSLQSYIYERSIFSGKNRYAIASRENVQGERADEFKKWVTDNVDLQEDVEAGPQFLAAVHEVKIERHAATGEAVVRLQFEVNPHRARDDDEHVAINSALVDRLQEFVSRKLMVALGTLVEAYKLEHWDDDDADRSGLRDLVNRLPHLNLEPVSESRSAELAATGVYACGPVQKVINEGFVLQVGMRAKTAVDIAVDDEMKINWSAEDIEKGFRMQDGAPLQLENVREHVERHIEGEYDMHIVPTTTPLAKDTFEDALKLTAENRGQRLQDWSMVIASIFRTNDFAGRYDLALSAQGGAKIPVATKSYAEAAQVAVTMPLVRHRGATFGNGQVRQLIAPVPLLDVLILDESSSMTHDSAPVAFRSWYHDKFLHFAKLKGDVEGDADSRELQITRYSTEWSTLSQTPLSRAPRITLNGERDEGDDVADVDEYDMCEEEYDEDDEEDSEESGAADEDDYDMLGEKDAGDANGDAMEAEAAPVADPTAEMQEIFSKLETSVGYKSYYAYGAAKREDEEAEEKFTWVQVSDDMKRDPRFIKYVVGKYVQYQHQSFFGAHAYRELSESVKNLKVIAETAFYKHLVKLDNLPAELKSDDKFLKKAVNTHNLAMSQVSKTSGLWRDAKFMKRMIAIDQVRLRDLSADMQRKLIVEKASKVNAVSTKRFERHQRDARRYMRQGVKNFFASNAMGSVAQRLFKGLESVEAAMCKRRNKRVHDEGEARAAKRLRGAAASSSAAQAASARGASTAQAAASQDAAAERRRARRAERVKEFRRAAALDYERSRVQYHPDGGTAMVDGVMATVRHNSHLDFVSVTIFTDGQENQSRLFIGDGSHGYGNYYRDVKPEVKAEITTAKDSGSWIWKLYGIGRAAEQSCFEYGAKMGLDEREITVAKGATAAQQRRYADQLRAHQASEEARMASETLARASGGTYGSMPMAPPTVQRAMSMQHDSATSSFNTMGAEEMSQSASADIQARRKQRQRTPSLMFATTPRPLGPALSAPATVPGRMRTV